MLTREIFKLRDAIAFGSAGGDVVAGSGFSSLALALLCQILAARSIIGAAILPLEHLTEQAELDAGSQPGERLAVVLTRTAFAAASPHLTWPPRSNRPIVIWYGEARTE